MTAHSPLEIISWVLSLGSAAELTAPDWLRKDIQAEIAMMAEDYKPPRFKFKFSFQRSGSWNVLLLCLQQNNKERCLMDSLPVACGLLCP